jgi:hypothetical protein
MGATNEVHLGALRNQLRQRLLQWMFPLTVAWLVFSAMFVYYLEWSVRLYRMNPFPEGQLAHQVFEDWIETLMFIAILAVCIGIEQRWALRRWPGLLRLPVSAPLSATTFRFVIHCTGLFAAVAVGSVLFSYLSYDPATDPQGQFHAWVWLSGFVDAVALAPVVALVTTWLTITKKHDACCGRMTETVHPHENEI